MAAAATGTVRFGPDFGSLVAVVILTFGAVPLALSSSLLLPLLLVPLAWGVWVLRARVVVTQAALEVCNGLAVHRLAWPEVEGYDVPARGPVRVLGAKGSLALTALPRNRVRALVEASEQVAARPAPPAP